MLRQRLQTSHCEMGGQDVRASNAVRDWSVGRSKRTKDRDEQLGPEDVFSSMPPSEGLKMLASTMMTGHDDGNHADGPFEMATWDVPRAHFYGEARRWIYTYLPEGHEQVGQTLQEHVRNARCSVNLGRHLVRNVEGWFHEGRNRVPRFLLQSRRRSQRIASW